MTMLEGCSLTERTDTDVWMLEKSGNLTTKTVYKMITFLGIVDLRMKDIWETKLPLKIEIFLWMVAHDQVQTTEQLKKRNCKEVKVAAYAERRRPLITFSDAAWPLLLGVRLEIA